jgi:hypothetical protein
MYQPPTIFDFQRNLDTIIHDGEHEARAQVVSIKSDAARRGAGLSTGVIVAAITSFDKIHKTMLERAMRLIEDFAKRNAGLSPAALAQTARPRLDGFATFLLATLPPTGFPQEAEWFAGQYTLVFRQRLEGALRDIETGFIGGRSVAAQPEKTIQANALRLLQVIDEATRGSSMPVYIGDLPNLGMNEEEAKAAYHYLRGKDLIDANFKIAYAARLSARGHDAITDAQRAPDQTSPAFPAITYNYLHVETMTGSNIQQGTTNSQIARHKR